jgi:hypothetical protein
MLNPSTDPDFTGKVGAPTTAYPYGVARDATIENDPAATPLLAKKFKDDWGFDAALLAAAGIVPTGTADTALTSQRLKAMQYLFGKNFPGVAAMKAATGLVVGEEVSTGHTHWEVVSYVTTVPLVGGLYAQQTNALNILDFGADNTGVALANDALNDAADVGAVYAPKGSYNLSGFARRIRPGFNAGQERLRVYGDLTPMTSQHQFMVATTIFEGDGDMFLDVVNYAFVDIGIRNKVDGAGAPITPGYLFKMYGQGLEGGVWVNCYFGACLRHFDRTTTTVPSSIADYIIGPNFDKCAFAYAQEVSRNFDGVTANYTETGKCYTAHCKAGLKSRSPGPGLNIGTSIFEYINDYAVDVVAYGFVANYSVALESVFFESCGGNLATIPGVAPTGERAKALPSVRISTESPGGAPVKFSHKGCFATYTGANPPAAWFEIPAATTTIDVFHEAFVNGTPAVAQVYTSSTAAYVNPFGTNGNSIIQLENNGIRIGGLGGNLNVGGSGTPNATLQVNGENGGITGWLANAGTNVDVRMVATGVAGQFGQDSTNGFYISETAGSKDVTVKSGNLKTLKPGKGLTVVSPDGLVTKTLTINNAGALVLI